MAKKGGAPTKSEILAAISKDTDLSRKQVSSVFDSLASVIRKSLRSHGIVTLPGLLKLKVVKKPATKARKGINPFTKEEVMFKAKPARKVVKVLALKALKELGGSAAQPDRGAWKSQISGWQEKYPLTYQPAANVAGSATVSVALHGDRLRPGHVVLAPSDGNLVVENALRLRVEPSRPAQLHVPEVDRMRFCIDDAEVVQCVAVADTAWVEKVVAQAVKTVSPKKIMLGVPTYGYEWEIT